MNQESLKTQLTRQLADWLTGGIELSREVVDYIDSTLAPESAEALESLLNDAESCETDAVIELIFFPDTTLQEQIEPIAAQAGLTETDLSEIKQALNRENIKARIRFPDHRQPLSLQVPSSAIDQLIARLHLTRQLDEQLARAISEAGLDAQTARQVRVKLRNARIAQSETQVNFLSRLIDKLAQQHDLNTESDATVTGATETGATEFWKTLDFVLYLLEQTETDADLFAALMSHKKLLIRAIQTAQKNQSALSSNTVEALIMQGVSIPSINIESARETIDRIDRTSLLVFGRTEYLPPPEAAAPSMDLSVGDEADLRAMMRLLG